MRATTSKPNLHKDEWTNKYIADSQMKLKSVGM